MSSKGLVFMAPPEVPPVPSIGSDEEESFVVLGHGPDESDASCCSPVGASIIDEARSLIGNEIAALEKANEEKNNAEALKKSSGNSGIPEMPVELVNGIKNEENLQTYNNTPISIATLPPDLSSEEVQNKITEIIEENIKLKDTILQNNMSMKLQYDRIIAWKEDVQKVHEIHKEKFLEAKEYIEKLKKEINQRDEEIKTLREKYNRKISSENIELQKSTLENIKQFDLDAANNKIKELENALEQMTLKNAQDTEKPQSMESKFNEFLIEEKKKMTEQGEDLLDQNKKLMEEVEKLKGQFEESKLSMSMVKSQIKDEGGEAENLKAAIEKLKLENGQIEQARVEAMKLYAIEAERGRMMAQKISALDQHIFQLQQQLQFGHPQPNAFNKEEVHMVRQQLMSSQAALTECQQERAEALIKIEELKREVARLTGELEQTKSRDDEVFALQTQLELYKADYEAERQAKEAFKEERDKVVQDIEHLHRRNFELQEQVEGRVTRDRQQRTAAPSAPSSGGKILRCPKCSFGFNTLQALENHVYRCIELNENLP